MYFQKEKCLFLLSNVVSKDDILWDWFEHFIFHKILSKLQKKGCNDLYLQTDFRSLNANMNVAILSKFGER